MGDILRDTRRRAADGFLRHITQMVMEASPETVMALKGAIETKCREAQTQTQTPPNSTGTKAGT